MLADERTALAAQSDGSGPDQPTRPGQLSAAASPGFLPARHQSLSGPDGVPTVLPRPRLAAEPSWHVIGTSVSLWLGQQGSAGHSTAHPGAQLGRVGLADPPAAAPVLPTESEPAEVALEAVSSEPEAAEDTVAGAAPSRLVPSGPRPADPGSADAALPDAVPVPAASPDPAVAAVRDTFAVVQAAGKEAASYFYGWLFASHPELRELFPPAMTCSGTGCSVRSNGSWRA
jgi:hypothetical protein